jgi:hypothetical protein
MITSINHEYEEAHLRLPYHFVGKGPLEICQREKTTTLGLVTVQPKAESFGRVPHDCGRHHEHEANSLRTRLHACDAPDSSLSEASDEDTLATRTCKGASELESATAADPHEPAPEQKVKRNCAAKAQQNCGCTSCRVARHSRQKLTSSGMYPAGQKWRRSELLSLVVFVCFLVLVVVVVVAALLLMIALLAK